MPDNKKQTKAREKENGYLLGCPNAENRREKPLSTTNQTFHY